MIAVVFVMDRVPLCPAFQSLIGQCSVHGFDDVATLAQLLEGVVDASVNNPAPRFYFFSQSQAFQLRKALEEAISLRIIGSRHFFTGAHINRIIVPNPSDKVPVKPREAVLPRFVVELELDFLLALRAQFAGQNLAGPVTDPMGDIVPGNVEGRGA